MPPSGRNAGRSNSTGALQMKLLAAALALALTACATQTSGVVQLSNGMRKVIHQTNAGVFYDPERLATGTILEAGASCDREGRRFQVLEVAHRPPLSVGNRTEAEVLFRCD